MKKRLVSIAMTLILTLCPLLAGAFSVSALEQAYVHSGLIYRIKNVDSGKYLTVCNGADADDVNVIQKEADNTLSQQFRIAYNATKDAYRLFAMCSSNGFGRVLQPSTPVGLESGCNVVLKSVSEDLDTQYWNISFYMDYRVSEAFIKNKSDPSYMLRSTAGDGSMYGTAPDSAGNVWMDLIGSASRWTLEIVNPYDTVWPSVYYIKNKETGSYMGMQSNGYVKMTPKDQAEKWQVLYLGDGKYEIRPQSDPAQVFVVL